MAKEKTNAPRGGILHFVRFGLYKRNQGRITRQVSFAVLAVVIGLASWKLYQTLSARIVPGATWLSSLSTTLEVQSAYTTATGGTLTFGFRDEATSAVQFDASATEIKAALLTIDGFNDLEVVGSGTETAPWEITFNDPGNTDLAELTIDGAALTGGEFYVATLSNGTNLAEATDFYSSLLAFGIGLSIFLLGVFISYRIVNLPRFADFLISVEAEMNKVSWPSQGELFRSSIVVIVVIFFLALTLFLYDVTWSSLFKAFGISPS